MNLPALKDLTPFLDSERRTFSASVTRILSLTESLPALSSGTQHTGGRAMSWIVDGVTYESIQARMKPFADGTSVRPRQRLAKLGGRLMNFVLAYNSVSES